MVKSDQSQGGIMNLVERLRHQASRDSGVRLEGDRPACYVACADAKEAADKIEDLEGRLVAALKDREILLENDENTFMCDSCGALTPRSTHGWVGGLLCCGSCASKASRS